MENYIKVDDTQINSNEDKIVSVLTGQASQEELAALRQWLTESEDNRKLYDEYAVIWGTSRAVGRIDDYRLDNAWALFSKQMKQQRHRAQHVISLKKALIVAATVALVFMAGMAIYRSTSNVADEQSQLTYTEYKSPYGSKSKVNLPDGSLVWLNAGSTLRFSSDFNISDREVYLEGEGYFDVAHNEQTSFWVHTSTVTVKVLGTAFNVKAYPEESFVETIVERGVVQLIDPLSSSQETTILHAKQKAVVMKELHPEVAPEKQMLQDEQHANIKPLNYIPIADVEVDSNVATESYTSWKDSRWVVEREKLSSLAVKLERRYNVRIVFSDEELKDYVLSGTFEDETLEQVLEVMRLTAPVVYEVQQNTVYLKRNKMFNPY